MESLEHRGLRITWDPPRARLHVVYGPQPLDGRDAEAILPRVTSWVDAVPRFTMFVDVGAAREVPLSWRAAWVGWFRERRERLRVAIIGAKALDSLAIPTFAWMSGADMRTFEEQPAAEAWLREAESF